MIHSYISLPLHLLYPFQSPVRMRSAHTREYIPLSYIVNRTGEESSGEERQGRGEEAREGAVESSYERASAP